MTRILSPGIAVALVLATASMHGQTPPAAPTPPPQPARATPAPPRPAATPTPTPGARLPVRRVVLYKSGIGYFEHLGRVSGAQTVSIDLTSGQLDDVLKSLTTVDLGGGQVTGITYNTEAPIEEQLRKLRLPLAPDVTRTKLLEALRGARVEVRAGGVVVAGRILSVAAQIRGKDESQRTVDELTIVTDGGELRSFELGPGVGVTIVEGELRRDLGQYLDVMGSARSQEVRRLQVAARGTGDRDLFVSYVSAVPVWKTTYRLVIPTEAARKPFLQGWAIVDNTLGEDWTDVELSLVAGAPQSFIQELSKPIYTRRPVVPIQTGTVVAPEIHGGAMSAGPASLRGRVVDNTGAPLPGATVKVLSGDREVASTVSDGNGGYTLGAVPSGSVVVQGLLSGFKTTQRALALRGGSTTLDLVLEVGSLSEAVQVTTEQPRVRGDAGRAFSVTAEEVARLPAGRGSLGGVVGGSPAAPPPPSPADLEDAMADLDVAAAGGELGELFEYKLKQPVTIRRNQSAMVPVVQHDVAVERVSLWSAARGVTQPLRAVWLTNDTGLTLDGGSLTLVEGGAFAGEGLVEAIKPGEKRFVSYAVDLGVRVTAAAQDSGRRVSRIRIASSVMTQSVEERGAVLYTVRNDDATPREVVIEHPVRAGWALTGGVKPAETSATAHRFKVAVAAKSTATLTVAEVRPIDQRTSVSNIADDQIAVILRGRNVAAGIEPQLRAVAAASRELAEVQRAIYDRQAEVRRIGEDQGRVRENLKALKGSDAEKALVQRYTGQLSAQEDRLDALRKEIAVADADRAAKQQDLSRLVAALSLDVELP
ncbi:MAG: carboxypeptidase regulatory-like domain-containing protein [Vicinamibacteraceae bacterium]